MFHLPPLATSLPASLSSPPSDTHTVTLGTYLSFAQYGVGVALLLRPLINMHSGSVCLVGVLSVSVCLLPLLLHVHIICRLACHSLSGSPSCFMSHISSFSSLLSFFTSLFFSNGQDIGREPHPLSHLLTMFSHLGCFPLCSPFFFPPLSSPFCSSCPHFISYSFPPTSSALDIFLVLVSSRCLSSSPYSSFHLSPSYLLSSFILIIFLAFLFISS